MELQCQYACGIRRSGSIDCLECVHTSRWAGARSEMLKAHLFYNKQRLNIAAIGISKKRCSVQFQRYIYAVGYCVVRAGYSGNDGWGPNAFECKEDVLEAVQYVASLVLSVLYSVIGMCRAHKLTTSLEIECC